MSELDFSKLSSGSKSGMDQQISALGLPTSMAKCRGVVNVMMQESPVWWEKMCCSHLRVEYEVELSRDNPAANQ